MTNDSRRDAARSDTARRNKNIAVYGAYGHTGRFVVQELRKRGWTPIASGRDAEKLRALAAMGLETDIRKLTARGVRPALLGALAFLFIASFSLALIKLFG